MKNWSESVFLCLLYLISRASGKNELAVGVEAQAVDFSGVSVHGMTGFGCVVGTSVPSGGGLGRGRSSSKDFLFPLK